MYYDVVRYLASNEPGVIVVHTPIWASKSFHGIVIIGATAWTLNSSRSSWEVSWLEQVTDLLLPFLVVTLFPRVEIDVVQRKDCTCKRTLLDQAG